VTFSAADFQLGEGCSVRIAATYSYKNGEVVIKAEYPQYLAEITTIIQTIDASLYRTKQSKEKTMPGRMLYNPRALNAAFKEQFRILGWASRRIEIKTPTLDHGLEHRGFREVDFVKDVFGVEVQFGKYAFLVYDISTKMVIFNKLGILKVGVEILPTHRMTSEMSSGIGHFEQVVADLYHRGEADIDIPMMIIGIEPDTQQSESKATSPQPPSA
jgi:hypothetical protein